MPKKILRMHSQSRIITSIKNKLKPKTQKKEKPKK
jgi:hypothetical protein